MNVMTLDLVLLVWCVLGFVWFSIERNALWILIMFISCIIDAYLFSEHLIKKLESLI